MPTPIESLMFTNESTENSYSADQLAELNRRYTDARDEFASKLKRPLSASDCVHIAERIRTWFDQDTASLEGAKLSMQSNLLMLAARGIDVDDDRPEAVLAMAVGIERTNTRVVKANSVEDYLSRYYKRERVTSTLLETYTRQYQERGWISTSHHDNTTGAVIYWPSLPRDFWSNLGETRHHFIVNRYRLTWYGRQLAVISAPSAMEAISRLLQERGYGYLTPDVIEAEQLQTRPVDL